MKNISQKQKTLFPFVMHCDFSIINADGDSQLSDEFETLCKKQSNGQIKISEQLDNNLLIYASAIKPGSRFTDEQSVIQITPLHGVRLIGSDSIESIFGDESKVEIATKEINMKSTFKIEKTED